MLTRAELVLAVSLYLSCLRHVFCAVSPPMNVSVTCHNFENFVYWNYSDPKQDVEFTVTIQQYRGSANSTVTTTETYLDITPYTDDPTNAFFISVETRQKGTEHTSASDTVHFTYDQDFPSKSKCEVDFPAVDVLNLQHSIKFTFDHPSYVYDSVNLSDVFEYIVYCNETECGQFVCFDELCEETVHLPEHLYGQCFIVRLKGDIDSIPFQTMKNVCNDPSKPDETLIITLVCIGVGVIMLLIAGGAIVYKKLYPSSSQNAIVSKILNIMHPSAVPPVVVPEQPPVSEVRSVSHIPLLMTPDEISPITMSPSPPAEITHFPCQPITEELCEEEEPGSSVDEWFNNGGYDSKKFLVEMSPGDAVEAYRP